MKKNIVKLLLLGQVLWVFHGGIIFSQNFADDIENYSYSYNYGGFYGLVKIACTTFVESINRVVEVSCDLPIFPKNKTSKKPVQKVQLIFINYLTNTSIRYFLQVGQLKTKFCSGLNSQLSSSDFKFFQLNYMCITFLFLYMHKLRYFFLRARSSISNRTILVLGNVISNPNCFCEGRPLQEQLGFFYFNSFNNEVKIYE